MEPVRAAINILRAREANLSCAELVRLLESLGFDVRRGKSGNHHTLDHSGIPGFAGSNFDGGHDKTVKKCYTSSMRRLLTKYEVEISDHLRHRND